MAYEPELIEQEEQDLFEHLRVVVDKGQSLLRIDKFLMHRVENASRNRIQNAIELGNVLVNDKPIKSSYRVKPLDVISVVLPHPPRDTEVYPENIPINIVYEDDDVLVVDKAAGMVVHPGYNNYTGTLVNALVYHFQQLPTLPGNDGRPGLVHRIDKDTSGLLLISKNERSMSWLAKQFFDHTITRKYIALVWGDLVEDGTVTGYIGRSIADRRVMSIYDDPEKGKWSVTHYKVLERMGYVTLIECQLETGRTHQIRAHMRHIGHPLFSDATYGGDKILKGTVFSKYKQFVENCFELMPRQALHAQTLGFLHPTQKKQILFESPLPPDFESVLLKWRRYTAADNQTNANSEE
ncbi:MULTISPECIES: RluA family pseudouridine synthase [unclassified Mucilaginibacter]|jgi:23S rRNA pseudouridine1911/1915/1917 synthase|uniref:RluA family pseudouridine synthase n=1 Tax=unclassified Mucilaginibacter TaxID=2617802 RepID=UPI0008D7E49D|nr:MULTISPECIES: RluA family pseudouridine synthase [unclassified Mucilaginibacter]WDF76358.1 RluA family pseudouridine synthase [Mucilaginibacter sp. KACC 22773]SEP42368.1 23S rRNA pseudouridine1911/1915/1917 synthase [Mucilaginibacter sp. OK283]